MTGVLVTGAGGFVGSALCPALSAAGYAVRRAARRAPQRGDGEIFESGELDERTDWRPALRDIGCVVHLAARTHVMRETAADPLAEFRRINVAATLRLAEQAAAAGVRRLVFLSSIKVNGEATTARPYTEDDPPRPEDAYGTSKWEAEQALRQLSAATGLEVAVLRPPLVYGPGVKGNLLRLLALVSRETPLPLASVRNRRSLVYLGNLVDAILAATAAPPATAGTWLVSDGEDVSTPALVRALAQALGARARLFPFPVPALRTAAALLGKGPEVARLTGSLQVDASRIRRELNWAPRYTLAQGLAETARWFRTS